MIDCTRREPRERQLGFRQIHASSLWHICNTSGRYQSVLDAFHNLRAFMDLWHEDFDDIC